MYLETYLKEIIEDEKKGHFFKVLLRGLSTLFKVGVKLRHVAFDQKWLKNVKVSKPVVSIGNIIAGGTGKTPLIKKLGQDLASFGKLAILSRGYRSEANDLHLKPGTKFTAKECGDEPYLLFKALPNAHIFVGRDRISNAKKAIKQGSKLILLDDGMQYRKLHRDLEIVMLHADDLYGKGFYLPRGYLRDCPTRLKDANYIFVHHVGDKKTFEEIKKRLSKYSHASVIGTRMNPKQIVGKELKNKKVALFCGLGSPLSFIKTVEEMGANIQKKWLLPDHSPPSIKGLKAFAKRACEQGCDLILCSEKDKVKLPENIELTLPFYSLEAEIEIIYGQEIYLGLIKKMKEWMVDETVD